MSVSGIGYTLVLISVFDSFLGRNLDYTRDAAGMLEALIPVEIRCAGCAKAAPRADGQSTLADHTASLIGREMGTRATSCKFGWNDSAL
jgi:hypothetical protein